MKKSSSAESVPDHQGNIVGIYNSAADSLEQYTDYYPYGMPHATATAPQLNRRKYGAKELTTDLGLNLYDFAARWHNPAFPRFTSPDPLSETKCWNSGYIFCGDDPINFIDPTGLDEYEVDHKGIIINIIPNFDKDIFHIVDESGNIISSSKTYDYGSVKIFSKNDETSVSYDLYEFCDDEFSMDIFEFFSNNTSVEWGTAKFILTNGDEKSIVTTSHSSDSEAGLQLSLGKKYNLFSKSSIIDILLYHIHSHPNNSVYPSGISKGESDIKDVQLAKMYRDILGYVIVFKIYVPEYDIYIPYSGDSISSDFYYYRKKYGQ